MLQPTSFIKKQFSFLTSEDAQKLLDLGKVTHLKAGDIFIEAGETTYSFAIIINGLLRNFHTVDEYTEKTVGFSREGQCVMSYATAFTGKPSAYTVEALEDTGLLVLDFRALKTLSHSNTRIGQIINDNLAQRLLTSIARIDDFVLRSPEQRYLCFADENPELFDRLRQKHLASYLGITPISLSRMKARLQKKSA